MAIDVCIDVSDAQGIIDWPAVAASGIILAFVKATEGSSFKARNYDANAAGARGAGLLVTSYDFLRPDYAATEAEFFVKSAGLVQGSRYMLDWEGRASDTCTAAQAEQIGSALRSLTGFDPVGYWGITGSTPAEPTAAMRRWPRFIPRYPREGARSFTDLSQSARANPHRLVPGAYFWQYTQWGQVPGISHPVDRSVWLGTEAQLRSWFATGAFS